MSTAANVREEFEKKNLKYKVIKEMPDGTTVIVAGFNNNVTTFDIQMVFDSEDHTVMLRVNNLAKVPIDRQFEVLTILNQINGKFRWSRFFMDDESNVNVQIDHIHTADENADCVIELIFRINGIIEEVFPLIMKAIWA